MRWQRPGVRTMCAMPFAARRCEAWSGVVDARVKLGSNTIRPLPVRCAWASRRERSPLLRVSVMARCGQSVTASSAVTLTTLWQSE